jgi:hypothetical protein
MRTHATKKTKSDCAVCCSEHDAEIHEATLRIHRWLLDQVTRNFEDRAVPASEMQPELVAS